MADPKKISELTTAGPLTGVELLPIVQNSGTLQTNLATVAIFATSAVTNDVAAVSLRLDQVSAAVSANTAAITSVNAVVSALEVRVSAVSAAAVSLSSALTSTNNVVSALEVRVSAASATGAANAAAITSINNVVSALEIRVSAASATGATNAAAITSINNVVSALEIRVSAASATGAANSAAITSINNVVSVLDVRLTAVSASVSVLNVQMLAVQASISAINSALAAIDASALAALEPRVSALEIRVAAVSASVSALQVQVNAVSVLTSINAAAITSVNAVVSTKVNRVGDFLTEVQYIDFDTSGSTAPTTAGELTWNLNDGTLDVGLHNGVTLQVGQETLFYIKNGAAVSIATGQLVMATSALGASGKIIGAPAIANGTVSPEYFLGVAAQTIAPNDFGYVADFGLVRGFNSSGAPYGETWVDGQILFANASVTGGLTNSAPAFPGFSTPIAIVINAATGGSGSIFVRMKTGEYLRQLHDVDLVSVSNNDIIVYNTSLSAWINSPALTVAQASISALNIQLAAVSAVTSVNAAAITSINNVVSALEIRVSAVSALVSSAFVSIGQRVLKAGDTMTGQLAIAVAANTIGVSVSGGLVVTSVVNFTGDSALLLHSGTTATRPTSVTPGLIRFNSGSNTFEGYTSATWGAIGGGGGATGGGTNQAFYLNDTEVSVSYSIPSGKNAGTFGPITVASGVTVEVPSGSTWTVV
jgi:hypothetical protein